jgi:ABC-type sugar transport system ATPase subunit
MSPPPLLELRSIVKRYGEVVAVNGASLQVAAGEVHALVGENGAGKSTLMKILSGAIRNDAGSVLIDGDEVELASPTDAIAAGVGMIPQVLQLVPAMTVAENIVLGAEPVRRGTPFLDRGAMEEIARRALASLGETMDVTAPVGGLIVARRQIVEIARAISRKVRILALDEPSASLTAREIEGLFGLIRRLKADGVAILYISHRLDEIFEIADRVTILRDGAVVASEPTAALDRRTMIRHMVGRELDDAANLAPAAPGDEILRLEGVSGGRLRGIDLVLRRGEILGLAGLVGAGRTELARLIFGADFRSGGRMWLAGRPIDPRSPREAIAHGIGLLTEDRDRLGLVPDLDVSQNITLAGLRALCRGPFVDRARERAAASGHAARLRIKAPSLEARVSELSGGNRQKVVLARWLEVRSRVLIFDEPTAGVDVGARSEIHALVRELAASGTGVMVVSSDLDELLGLCDRIVVMCEGRITGEVSRAEATRGTILQLATSRSAAASA